MRKMEKREVVEMLSKVVGVSEAEAGKLVDMTSVVSSNSSLPNNKVTTSFTVKLIPSSAQALQVFLDLDVRGLEWKGKSVFVTFPNMREKNKCVMCNECGHMSRECPSQPLSLRLLFSCRVGEGKKEEIVREVGASHGWLGRDAQPKEPQFMMHLFFPSLEKVSESLVLLEKYVHLFADPPTVVDLEKGNGRECDC